MLSQWLWYLLDYFSFLTNGQNKSLSA